MHIDQLEKKWVMVALLIVGLMVSAILVSSFIQGIDAPSNVETIDSAKLHLSKEFSEDNLGVQTDTNGNILIRMVAGRYGFYPKHIKVPTDTKLTFRWVSMDVIHGVHIPMTNMSTMVVPGYVAQVTTVLKTPGDYPMICNEYCGMGHAHMWSNITVVAKQDWQQVNNGGLSNGQ